MSERRNWTRDELILTLNLYCRTPFGKIHNRNPDVIKLSKHLNRTPSAISYKLANLASIDPSLPRKGASNVSKLDKEVWNEFFDNLESMAYESEILCLSSMEKSKIVNSISSDVPKGEEKEQLVRTRINQSFFRKTILATYDYKCCITGIAIPDVLIASHIVPWSKDEANRLNPMNGLCLNALHDRAFDSGLITLSDDYTIILSKRLKGKGDTDAMATFFQRYEGEQISIPDRFLPAKSLIGYHRVNIFKGLD